MSVKLLLLSSSQGRMRLLQEANIAFQVLPHSSLEDRSPVGLSPEELVVAIAQDKMQTLVLPPLPATTTEILILAADTLVFAADGEVCGKPVNEQEARRMLDKFATSSINVVTGCCLQKMQLNKLQQWEVVATRTFSGKAELLYAVPKEAHAEYFEAIANFLNIAGGAQVEGYGAQFVQWINGSYTTIQGLPMFELREELKAIGF